MKKSNLFLKISTYFCFIAACLLGIVMVLPLSFDPLMILLVDVIFLLSAYFSSDLLLKEKPEGTNLLFLVIIKAASATLMALLVLTVIFPLLHLPVISDPASAI